jgi:hypothetical protein
MGMPRFPTILGDICIFGRLSEKTCIRPHELALVFWKDMRGHTSMSAPMRQLYSLGFKLRSAREVNSDKHRSRFESLSVIAV